MKLKKGDLVIINDGSYAQTVRDGKLIQEPRHHALGCKQHRGKTYVVVETDCSFPLEVGTFSCFDQPEKYKNDVVIQESDNGEVVFIHHCFLSLVKHKIVIDGKTVEISHESFLNLKRLVIFEI